jgi:predicted transcriptional regulator
MPVQLAITLNDDQKARLESLVQTRQASPADLAAEAVTQYLDDDAAFRAAVEAGLAAGRAGDVADFAPFAAGMRERMKAALAGRGE